MQFCDEEIEELNKALLAIIHFKLMNLAIKYTKEEDEEILKMYKLSDKIRKYIYKEIKEEEK